MKLFRRTEVADGLLRVFRLNCRADVRVGAVKGSLALLALVHAWDPTVVRCQTESDRHRALQQELYAEKIEKMLEQHL